VRDHNGRALAYVYFEEEHGRRAAAHLMTRDEARRRIDLRHYRLWGRVKIQDRGSWSARMAMRNGLGIDRARPPLTNATRTLASTRSSSPRITR
jgi:hypothetical protein